MPKDLALTLPEGWTDAPTHGKPTSLGNPEQMVVPCKTPLGEKFNQVLGKDQRFGPGHIAQLAEELDVHQAYVVNLTKTERYYRPEELSQASSRVAIFYDQVRKLDFAFVEAPYVASNNRNGVPQIPCEGKGGAPKPAEVNQFCYSARLFLSNVSHSGGRCAIFVHCTHGFNRTGAMIVHLKQRLGWPDVVKHIREFNRNRPPGIYKESYLSHLFDYYHEPRPSGLKAPAEPEFKQAIVIGDAPRIDPLDVPASDLFGPTNVDFVKTVRRPDIPIPQLEPDPLSIDPKDITHEHLHLIGEAIPEKQRVENAHWVSYLVLGKERYESQAQMAFPGAQPVSMDRSNIQNISQPDWAVTWKADGTRYMMLIMHDGAYLVNRKFDMARVQMRFPLPYRGNPPSERYTFRHTPPQGAAYHHLTLLDGELVKDSDPQSGVVLRFLAYDMIAVNGHPITGQPFKERLRKVTEEVDKPRKKLNDYRVFAPCNVQEERIRLRAKQFWNAKDVRQVCEKTLPQLTHEHDGLIFQSWNDVYHPRTDPNLLKYKYRHLNSVEFLVKVSHGLPSLHVQERDDKTTNISNIDGVIPASVLDESGNALGTDWDRRIAECAFNPEQECWQVIRERRDKGTPNHRSVFEKVWRSIRDGIDTEEVINVAEGRDEHEGAGNEHSQPRYDPVE